MSNLQIPLPNNIEKYCGQRTEVACNLYFFKNGETRQITPDKSLAVRNHSPTGFNWGYQGSGPAQLALAILLHATNSPEIANDLHQRFKSRFVGKFNDEWELDASVVREWLAEEEKPQEAGE